MNINVVKKLFLVIIILGYSHETFPKITTIIIAFSTLFEPDEVYIEKHIRSKLGVARSIGLFFSGIPSKEETKKAYFEILKSFPPDLSKKNSSINKTALQSRYFPWEKEYAFPPILRYYMLTQTAEQEDETYRYVSQKLEDMHDIPTSKKRIYQGLIDFLFQSKKMNPIMQPVEPIVNLMRSLKSKYHLILIGNVPGNAWKKFLQNFPQAKVISQLFKKEDIFISGIEGFFAQSREMYTKILTQNNLSPSECLVIESNPNNLKYPAEEGMKTIVFNTLQYKFKPFKTSLKKLLM